MKKNNNFKTFICGCIMILVGSAIILYYSAAWTDSNLEWVFGTEINDTVSFVITWVFNLFSIIFNIIVSIIRLIKGEL